MKTFYVGVKGIIREERGIVLLKKQLPGRQFWDVPGGRINGNETFEQTLERELQEELPGIKVSAMRDLQGAFRVPEDIDGSVSLVLLYFLVDAQLPTEVQLSEEHSDFLFIRTQQDIPRSGLSPVARGVIERLLSEQQAIAKISEI